MEIEPHLDRVLIIPAGELECEVLQQWKQKNLIFGDDTKAGDLITSLTIRFEPKRCYEAQPEDPRKSLLIRSLLFINHTIACELKGNLNPIGLSSACTCGLLELREAIERAIRS
jgi:hypothetical protein